MDSDDYAYVDRKDGSSVKYQIYKKRQPNVNHEKAIVVGHADMDFVLGPKIYEKFKQKVGIPHFGYGAPKPSAWSALENWVRARYYEKAKLDESNTIFWHNMLQPFNAVVETLTQPGDTILYLTPTYFKFIVQGQLMNRKCVDLELKTENHRFWIDFELLEKLIVQNKVKLFHIINPNNPSGRIWSLEELTKVKDLMIKYDVLISTDEIYSDWIQPAENQTIFDAFVSMLRFEDIHDRLIYANSYTKTWNCSGMSTTYSITYNEEIFKKIFQYNFYNMVSYPSTLAYPLMEVLYTSEEAKEWKLNTKKYIENNFKLFKELCSEKLPKLYIYDLEALYLCLVDFKEYGLKGKDLVEVFNSVDVCPTFTEQFYVEQKDRSLIRLNLACNVEIVRELVSRMEAMLTK